MAEVYVVMACTGGPGPKGVSAFLVPADAPGLLREEGREDGDARLAHGRDDHGGHTIPAANLIGQEGQGFRCAMSALDSGRITIGAISVGLSQAALDVASAYARQREQFGKPIIDFQGVGFMLADMAIHRAGPADGPQGRLASTMGAPTARSPRWPCAATDCAMSVTTDAIQALGGYGYTREYPVERYLRDAKITQIFEGTNQIQRPRSRVTSSEAITSGDGRPPTAILRRSCCPVGPAPRGQRGGQAGRCDSLPGWRRHAAPREPSTMKLCPICGSTYGDRVDFCFQDGAPLVAVLRPTAAGDAPATPGGPLRPGQRGGPAAGPAARSREPGEAFRATDLPRARPPASVATPRGPTLVDDAEEAPTEALSDRGRGRR